MSSAVVSLATEPTEHERSRPQKARGISADKCAQMLRYLLLGWDVKNIAEQCNVSQQTVYTGEQFDEIQKCTQATLSQAWPCTKAFKADETALFEYLMAEGWRQQDEMVGFGQSVDRISCFETQQVDTKRDKKDIYG